MHTIAIIGSGPTGIYTAKYLLEKNIDIHITMFESQAQAGKGTPYHQDWNEQEMLANIASIEIPPIMETLVDWLKSRTDEELATLGIVREAVQDRTFFPRVALGEYFHAQLNTLSQNKNFPERFTVKPHHTVCDVMIVESGIKLVVENNKQISEPIFDYVIMATGHVWPKDTEIRPGYFLSPWPSSALRTISDCHVGIRGTSLSAIDAVVALAIARGVFQRDSEDMLHYLSEPGTEAFHISLMSRKGLLPEADFFYPIPYEPLAICTPHAVKKLVDRKCKELLDETFALFKAELELCDPAYATRIQLKQLSLEEFSHAYFHEREQVDPFEWATLNLAEAKANEKNQHIVAWRYAIVRMHEVVARVVPYLRADDHKRFTASFKPVFVDNYATVPHESIERLLALWHAKKIDIIRLEKEYMLDVETSECGSILIKDGVHIHFPAFIEATGQRPLSLRDFPFPSLWKQGLLHNATIPYDAYPRSQRSKPPAYIGGIELDMTYHPVSDSPYASRLYCLSLPFILGQFPFAQGITSSHDMGKKVAHDIVLQLSTNTSIKGNNIERLKKKVI